MNPMNTFSPLVDKVSGADKTMNPMNTFSPLVSGADKTMNPMNTFSPLVSGADKTMNPMNTFSPLVDKTMNPMQSFSPLVDKTMNPMQSFSPLVDKTMNPMQSFSPLAGKTARTNTMMDLTSSLVDKTASTDMKTNPTDTLVDKKLKPMNAVPNKTANDAGQMTTSPMSDKQLQEKLELENELSASNNISESDVSDSRNEKEILANQSLPSDTPNRTPSDEIQLNSTVLKNQDDETQAFVSEVEDNEKKLVMERQATDMEPMAPFRETDPSSALSTTTLPGRLNQWKDQVLHRVQDNATTTNMFSLDVLASVLDDCLATLRRDLGQDILNVHVELLRQFEVQKQELQWMIRDAMQEAVIHVAESVSQVAGPMPATQALFDRLLEPDPNDSRFR
jgi:hypothetical protein